MLKVKMVSVFGLALISMLPEAASAVPTTFQASGANAAAIQGTVGAFRTALGNPNNGNNAGPLASGRREINWDGGGPPVIDGTAPVTPFTVFQNTRGATFTTLGTGLTQATATGGALSLDLINPQYASIFVPFSLNRMFTPIGSNITIGTFSIPGTNGSVLAPTAGFGAVFEDVDLANVTTIQFFDGFGGSLGTFSAPTFNNGLSFLGVVFSQGSVVSRVQITTGNSPLGPNDGGTTDVVVMDDFLYA